MIDSFIVLAHVQESIITVIVGYLLEMIKSQKMWAQFYFVSLCKSAVCLDIKKNILSLERRKLLITVISKIT